jgi:hypothetical protein
MVDLGSNVGRAVADDYCNQVVRLIVPNELGCKLQVCCGALYMVHFKT